MAENKEEIKQLRLRRNQFIREGRWADALEMANRLIAIAPTASRYTRRSMILIKLHRYNEALADIEKALTLDPQEQRAEKLLSLLVTMPGTEETEINESDMQPADVETPTAHAVPRMTRVKAGKKLSDDNATLRMEDDEGPILYSLTEAFLAQQVEQIMAEKKKQSPPSAAAKPGQTTATQIESEQTEPASAVTQDESIASALTERRPAVPTSQGQEPSLASDLTEMVGSPLLGGQEKSPAKQAFAGDDDGKTLPAGTRLGDYIVQEKIGQGGMGSVYKAVHVQLHQVVAIKVLPSDDVSAERVERFNQEAQLAAKLQHPHIVPIFHFGVEHGFYYLVMHWVDGVPLNTMLAEKRLTPRQSLDIMQQVAQAMACAHAAGVIHRDLKPSNIMIDRWGRAMVLDFGLAKSLETATDITRPGQILGTPKYMSPEQAAGDMAAVDARTDVYAMGVILYEMLTGKCPFDGESAHQVIYKILHEEPLPANKINARLHKDLETLVAKTMAREKFRRYAHAGELQDDIARYIHGEAILARPPSIPYRLYKWTMRHPARSGMLAVTMLFVLASVVWYRFLYDPHCQLKTMYDQAQSDTERETLLNTLAGQAAGKDAAFLLTVLAAGTPRQQAVSLRLLANIGQSVDQERIDAFLASFNDELVRAAIYAVGQYRRRDMLPKMRAFLTPDQDWRIRLEALHALSSIALAEAIPLCVEVLADNYALREKAQKILLRHQDKAIPHLLDALLSKQNANIWEAARVLETIGSPALEPLMAQLPRSDVERQLRILKVVAKIKDPAAVAFLIEQLRDAKLERKAFTLLHDLARKYPEDRRIAEILASHRPRFFLLVEAQCFGVQNDTLTHNIKVLSVDGHVWQQPRITVKLPDNVQLASGKDEHYNAQKKTLAWDVPLPIPQTGVDVQLQITCKTVGQGMCKVILEDNGREMDSMEYPIVVMGIAGAHCSTYDTEDPLAINDPTTYVVEARNEGNAPLTNLRFVSQVTPELEITEVVASEKSKESQARVHLICKDKAVVFLATPLLPGEKFCYQVKCKAVNIGSALHTVSLTYDQFAREISLSEGTMIYWR
jgi:hypothetical protein